MAAKYVKVHRGDHDLLNCNFDLESANAAKTVWVNIACGKDHRHKKNLSKPILWCTVYITKSLEMSEETNNPVYKVMADKLQLVLINLLTQQFLTFNKVG